MTLSSVAPHTETASPSFLSCPAGFDQPTLCQTVHWAPTVKWNVLLLGAEVEAPGVRAASWRRRHQLNLVTARQAKGWEGLSEETALPSPLGRDGAHGSRLSFPW